MQCANCMPLLVTNWLIRDMCRGSRLAEEPTCPMNVWIALPLVDENDADLVSAVLVLAFREM